MHIAFWLLLSLFLVRGDDGIGIDPHGGRRAGGLATAQGDDGPFIDPNGRRLSAAGDKGMGLDPNG